MFIKHNLKYLLVLTFTANVFADDTGTQSATQLQTNENNAVQATASGDKIPPNNNTNIQPVNAEQNNQDAKQQANIKPVKERLDNIIKNIPNFLNNGYDIQKIYYLLLSTNYKIVKECIDNTQQINRLADAEPIWQEVVNDNNDIINNLKQKLTEADSSKQYPLDSIVNMNDHYVTLAYPENIIADLIVTDTWETFVNEWRKIIDKINDSKTKFFADDRTKILNTLFNSTQVSGKKILDHLIKLQNIEQEEYYANVFGTELKGVDAIIFMTDLQEQINNNKIKTIDDFNKYYTECMGCCSDFIEKKKREICGGECPEEESPYIVHFIKTSNPWALNYTKNNFVYLYNECNGDLSQFKEEIKQLPDSELKNQYNNIFSKNIKTAVEELVAYEQEQVINHMQEAFDSVKSAENTYDFDGAYEYWLNALLSIDEGYLKYLQPNEQQEVINGLLTKIWELYNNPELQNVINKYLNGAYTKPNPALQEQYMKNLHEKIKNILTNAEFKAKTPFEQFKQLITIVPK